MAFRPSILRCLNIPPLGDLCGACGGDGMLGSMVVVCLRGVDGAVDDFWPKPTASGLTESRFLAIAGGESKVAGCIDLESDTLVVVGRRINASNSTSSLVRDRVMDNAEEVEEVVAFFGIRERKKRPFLAFGAESSSWYAWGTISSKQKSSDEERGSSPADERRRAISEGRAL